MHWMKSAQMSRWGQDTQQPCQKWSLLFVAQHEKKKTHSKEAAVVKKVEQERFPPQWKISHFTLQERKSPWIG